MATVPDEKIPTVPLSSLSAVAASAAATATVPPVAADTPTWMTRDAAGAPAWLSRFAKERVGPPTSITANFYNSKTGKTELRTVHHNYAAWGLKEPGSDPPSPSPSPSPHSPPSPPVGHHAEPSAATRELITGSAVETVTKELSDAIVGAFFYSRADVKVSRARAGEVCVVTMIPPVKGAVIRMDMLREVRRLMASPTATLHGSVSLATLSIIEIAFTSPSRFTQPHIRVTFTPGPGATASPPSASATSAATRARAGQKRKPTGRVDEEGEEDSTIVGEGDGGHKRLRRDSSGSLSVSAVSSRPAIVGEFVDGGNADDLLLPGSAAAHLDSIVLAGKGVSIHRRLVEGLADIVASRLRKHLPVGATTACAVQRADDGGAMLRFTGFVLFYERDLIDIESHILSRLARDATDDSDAVTATLELCVETSSLIVRLTGSP